MTMIKSAGEIVGPLLTKGMQEAYDKDHVRCPCCQEEWNRLMQCSWKNLRGQQDSTSVCVRCAETLQGFSFAMSADPIEIPVTGWTKSWATFSEFWTSGCLKSSDQRYYDPELGAERIDIITHWQFCRYIITAYKEGTNRMQADSGQWLFHKPSVKWFLIQKGNHLCLYDSKEWAFLAEYPNVFSAWADIRNRLLEQAVKLAEAERKINDSWGGHKPSKKIV